MEIKKIQLTSARKLSEMAKVLFDKTLAQKEPTREIYFVRRGVDAKDDLRYDITEIPAGMLGKEFVRSKGNRNSDNFPELYTLLEGEAIFLLQKTEPDKIGSVEEIFAVKAKRGDWVNIPADYSVVIINPGKETVKTGNWVSDKNKNIYQDLEQMGGMCYFAVAKKPKIPGLAPARPRAGKNPRPRPGSAEGGQKPKINWIKNKNYSLIPKLRFIRPLKKMPENLDYLKGN